MIITCEHCAAKYMVSEDALGLDGRSVKCAKCQKTWFAKPPSVLEVNNPISDITSKIVAENKKQLPAVRDDNWSFLLKISASILSLVLAFLFIIFFQTTVTSFIPASKKIYNMMHFFDTSNLELQNMAIRKIQKKENTTLVIKGQIYNKSKSLVIRPSLRITLYDDAYQKLLEHIIDLNQENSEYIKPGEMIDIDNNIRNLADNAKILKIDIGNRLELLLR